MINKIYIAILSTFLIMLITVLSIAPVQAQDYPLPPKNPDELWQPPIHGDTINPKVGVEIYKEESSSLQVVPNYPITPANPSSITNAYLVNIYGQILTNLHRNELCYLILSVNGPGYLYLWEYYPSGAVPYGHWLCYRWYRPTAGIWKIGPFIAELSDPPGRYVWKMWYLSGYSWSTRSLSFNYTGNYYPPDIPRPLPEPKVIPIINSFSTNKSSIESGEISTLSWTTTNAIEVSISPSIGTVATSGTTTVNPPSTTTYTLSAKSKTGNTTSSSITITVKPIVLPNISSSQSKIKRGSSTIISWSAPGANKVTITEIGVVNNSGSVKVSPKKTTTYTLTATYFNGSVQSSNITIDVEQPFYLLWGIIALIAIIMVIIAIILFKKKRAKTSPPYLADTKAGYSSHSDITMSNNIMPVTTPLTEVPPAKLIIDSGDEILLGGNSISLGRKDFEKYIPSEKVQYISRYHINIWYENRTYYIEDRSSTNGTKLNNTEIKGMGRQSLNNGDVIELANKVRITFEQSKEYLNKEVK